MCVLYLVKLSISKVDGRLSHFTFCPKGLEFDDAISDSIPGWEDDMEESNQSHDGFQLYESHIPTSMMQKVLLTTGSALMALYNPARAGNGHCLFVRMV